MVEKNIFGNTKFVPFWYVLIPSIKSVLKTQETVPDMDIIFPAFAAAKK